MVRAFAPAAFCTSIPSVSSILCSWSACPPAIGATDSSKRYVPQIGPEGLQFTYPTLLLHQPLGPLQMAPSLDPRSVGCYGGLLPRPPLAVFIVRRAPLFFSLYYYYHHHRHHRLFLTMHGSCLAANKVLSFASQPSSIQSGLFYKRDASKLPQFRGHDPFACPASPPPPHIQKALCLGG